MGTEDAAAKVDAVVQYGLAIASQAEDFASRALARTTLVKLVYLADLAHAAEHQGRTFTGLEWVFLHFGPWNGTVNDRVEPAAEAVHAEVWGFSKAGQERKRYRLETVPDRLLRSLESGLTPEVRGAVKRAVRAHHNDINGLLHDVYRTRPMLKARPHAVLDFSHAVPPPSVPEGGPPEPVRLSNTKKRKLKEEMKRRLEAARASEAQLLIPPKRPPRYDEVFERGRAAFDEEPLTEFECDARIDDSVWESDFRGDDDVP